MRKWIIFLMPIFLFFCISCTKSSSEEVRRPAVAGAFYPGDKEELIKMIDSFLSNAKNVDIDGRIIAIVVPHAGYIYSGQVAAYGFKEILDMSFKKIIIISPSHYVDFDGMSIYDRGAFETPLGIVKIDTQLAERIMKKNKRFIFYPEAHQKEHAIEVELPFLQRIYKDFEFVPIVMGRPNLEDAAVLSDVLYEELDKDTLLIISVDLSHYHSYDEAVQLDTSGLSAIEKLDAEWFLEQLKSGKTEIDAPVAVLATIMLGNRFGAEAKVLKYANSGDVTKDKTRVVGYSSIVIYVPSSSEKKGELIMKEKYLTKDEKEKLLKIARLSINEAVTGKKESYPDVTEQNLIEKCGAFVTIKKHGELRGCIGYIQAIKPLYETVKDVARSAAVNDFRFNPVSKDELNELELEISVLSPLKRIYNIDEIVVGKHGLFMKRGFNSGLLLPQVATEYNWDKETFLQHTCLKAGLSPGAWKDKSTEIYIFSAEVFSESD